MAGAEQAHNMYSGALHRPALRSLSILVVDDDPIIRQVIQGFLGYHWRRLGEGLTLHQAGSLEEGLAAVDHEKPDALILDLHLPDSQGKETFRTVRDRHPKLPIVVFSGSMMGRGQAMLTAEATGPSTVISKGDAETGALPTAIRKVLGASWGVEDLADLG